MIGRAKGRADPGGLALPGLTLALALLALALYLGGGAAPPSWVFDRAAIAQGEGWRLITGHLVHSDPEHLFWNLAALLLIGWQLERRDPALFAWGLVAGTTAVDAWLWLGLPGLQRYCGLSGVLNSLMLILLVSLRRETRGPWVMLIAILSAGKLVAELASGQAMLTHTAWPSVPSAHLAGLCGGMAVLIWRRRMYRCGPGSGTCRRLPRITSGRAQSLNRFPSARPGARPTSDASRHSRAGPDDHITGELENRRWLSDHA